MRVEAEDLYDENDFEQLLSGPTYKKLTDARRDRKVRHYDPKTGSRFYRGSDFMVWFEQFAVEPAKPEPASAPAATVVAVDTGKANDAVPPKGK